MKSTRVYISALIALPFADLCDPEPTPIPPLETITQWEHHGNSSANLECKTTIEAEPNETLVQANAIARPAVCESATIEGKVAGDVDAFVMSNKPCPDHHPTAELVSGPSDLRVCLFIACTYGKTGLDPNKPCPEGGTPYRTDAGVLGCCATDGGKVVVNSNCDAQETQLGSVPRHRGYVLVDRKNDVSCEPYSVKVSL